jgi:hypothetical protein
VDTGAGARAPRSWRRQEDPPLKPLERVHPADTLTLDFSSPNHERIVWAVFQTPCCSAPTKNSSQPERGWLSLGAELLMGKGGSAMGLERSLQPPCLCGFSLPCLSSTT